MSQDVERLSGGDETKLTQIHEDWAGRLAAFLSCKEACLEQESDVWVFKETTTAIPQRLRHWRLNRRSISQQNRQAVRAIKSFFIILSTSRRPLKLPSLVFCRRWNLDGDRSELLSARQVWTLSTPPSIESPACIFHSGSQLIGWLIDWLSVWLMAPRLKSNISKVTHWCDTWNPPISISQRTEWAGEHLVHLSFW